LLHTPSLLRHVSSRHTTHAAHPRHTTESAHASEHLCEYIVHVGTGTAAHPPAGIECSHAMGIVQVPLLVIVKDFVCLFCGFESDFGFLALFFDDFIGMML
jgi:hypothetical protein